MGKILIGNVLVGKVLAGNTRWAKYLMGNATGRQSTIDPVNERWYFYNNLYLMRGRGRPKTLESQVK